MRTVQKTGDSTVQFFGWSSTCPLVCKRQDLVRQCRKLWFRSCIPLSRWSMSLQLQFIDKVWTSLATVSRYWVPQIQLIAGVGGHPSCNRDGYAFSMGDGDDCFFFLPFRPFFALFQVVSELSASFRALDDEEFFVIGGSGQLVRSRFWTYTIRSVNPSLKQPQQQRSSCLGLRVTHWVGLVHFQFLHS